MNKTARDVLSEFASEFDIDHIWKKMIAELNAAGFVIAPKEPAKEMLAAAKEPSGLMVDGSSDQGGPRLCFAEPDQIAAIYRAMIAVAAEDT